MSTLVGPKATESVMKLGEMSSSTHRLWIGATALMTRPAIDYFNGDVDKETRKYSAIKTAVKVAITVFNGVLTRLFAEAIGLRLARRGVIKPIHNVDPESFAKGVATVVSFLATVFTTFTLDIPLINSGLNFALDRIFPDKKNPPPASGKHDELRHARKQHELDEYY